jgi:hypothetical protein
MRHEHGVGAGGASLHGHEAVEAGGIGHGRGSASRRVAREALVLTLASEANHLERQVAWAVIEQRGQWSGSLALLMSSRQMQQHAGAAGSLAASAGCCSGAAFSHVQLKRPDGGSSGRGSRAECAPLIRPLYAAARRPLGRALWTESGDHSASAAAIGVSWQAMEGVWLAPAAPKHSLERTPRTTVAVAVSTSMYVEGDATDVASSGRSWHGRRTAGEAGEALDDGDTKVVTRSFADDLRGVVLAVGDGEKFRKRRDERRRGDSAISPSRSPSRRRFKSRELFQKR